MKKSKNCETMIREIREVYGLSSPGVFFALKKVPREEFVPASSRSLSYSDCALSIGWDQTISQPYTVAFMTHLAINTLKKEERKKVLEIGTGSGYQAAVLSYLFKKVYTVERVKPLYQKAKETLKRLGIKNVFLKYTPKKLGWCEKAPFDVILVTAGVDRVPPKLFDQLKKNGILIAPEGSGYDKVMSRYIKGKILKKQTFGIFNFVPLIF